MAFIKLDRSFFDNSFWNEARVYSKAEAWLDLIQEARFEASTFHTNNGKVIELQKGELPISRRYLEERWRWGSSRVTNFLKKLVEKGLCTINQTNGQTTLSIVKYSDLYNWQTNNQTTKQENEEKANQCQTKIKEYKEDIYTHTHAHTHEEKKSDEDNPNVAPTEEWFLKRWKDARQYYLKKPTNIIKLTIYEKGCFNEIAKYYNRKQIVKAISGLFIQSNVFPECKLRPTHFLNFDKFENYYQCGIDGTKLYEDKKKSSKTKFNKGDI